MRLDHPLNFVCPEEKQWPEIRRDDLGRIDQEKLAQYSGDALDNWVLRTYYKFRMAGEPVTVSAAPDRNKINVVSIYEFGRRSRDPEAFILVARADGHRPQLGNFHLEQNFLNPPGRHRAAVLHWPQADIRPRGPERGTRIERVTFKGHEVNLDAAFRTEAFRSALQSLGVSFEIDARNPRSDALAGRTHSWNDYTDCDLTLAVRNMTVYDSRGKPASKLVNAWHADVAGLFGPEPAFREIRRSKCDYIEIRSADEAIDAIRFLKEQSRILSEDDRKRPHSAGGIHRGTNPGLLDPADQRAGRRGLPALAEAPGRGQIHAGPADVRTRTPRQAAAPVQVPARAAPARSCVR